MKIIIDTEQDSFAGAVHAVNAVFGVSQPNGAAAGPATPDGEVPLEGGWTTATLQQLVRSLEGEEAAIALRFIAEHAPAVSIDETIEHVKTQTSQPNFGGKAMGGKMSAITSGRKRIDSHLSGPHQKDTVKRLYLMDEQLAAALLEALDAVDAPATA